MLNLECMKANTNLPNFRLPEFLERIKCGFFKVFANRTVPSDLFGCRPAGKTRFVFNYLEIKIKYFAVWHNFCLEKIFIEKHAGTMSRLMLANVRGFDNL